METYYLEEKQNINSQRDGEYFEAASLDDAKKIAKEMQSFQGTILDLILHGKTVAYTDENGLWTDV